MVDDARQKIAARLHRLGIDLDVGQDEIIAAPCPYCDAHEAGDQNARIDLADASFHCRTCEAAGSLVDFLAKAEAARALVPQRVQQIEAEIIEAAPQDATFTDGALRQVRPKENAPLVLKQIKERATPRQPPAPPPRRHRRGSGERTIMMLLALMFLGAGLFAAILSGFANYQAFSGSVADPLQARIWGWAGIIASVVSFGGFTFFYWHTANKRMKEGIRAALFALAGAGTSIFGTQMYISNNNLMAASEVEKSTSNRQVIELQIEDWRSQLAGIPADTRSVEGLEAYLKGVEEAGRTHQKPYRDAQNELGLARRRDQLEAKIEAANAQLLGQVEDTDAIMTDAPQRKPLPAWFFAIMLEVFSSQGTSIGTVAMLILFGAREKAADREAPQA